MPIYMKITDAKGAPVLTGPVKAKGHEHWIELTTAQLNPLVGGQTVGSGRIGGEFDKVSDIYVTRHVDQQSQRIQQIAATGRPAPLTVVIDFVAAGNATRISLTLKNAMISSYSLAVGGGGKPSESFSFNFEGVAFTQSPAADVTAAILKSKLDTFRNLA